MTLTDRAIATRIGHVLTTFEHCRSVAEKRRAEDPRDSQAFIAAITWTAAADVVRQELSDYLEAS